MSVNMSTVEQVNCELHVAASGGQGARALACLLANVGQLHGLPTLSTRSSTDPLKVRPSHQGETATVLLAKQGERVRVTAVLEPSLMNIEGDGLLLVNSPETIRSETVRSLDAAGIARTLGVPTYLPMVGAVARAAGWHDLNRVKTAVRLALQSLAPYWVEPGVAAVEAGFHAMA